MKNLTEVINLVLAIVDLIFLICLFQTGCDPKTFYVCSNKIRILKENCILFCSQIFQSFYPCAKKSGENIHDGELLDLTQ